MSVPPAPPAAADVDTALVQRCRQGDEAAWSQLVQRYERLVFAMVSRAGLDEHTGADVFQTVFARLLEHLPGIQQPDRLQAWIVTTTKRELQRLRQRSARWVSLTPATSDSEDDGSAPAIDIADESPQAEALLSELQQLHRLQTALAQLDPRCASLLQLLFDGDPPPGYDEVARLTGMPHGSIGPTRARCLDKLRRLAGAG